MTREILKFVIIMTLSGLAFGQDSSVAYVTQVLEPLGGKIQRPIDWFYSEVHREQVYSWTISKEDISGGKPYDTGVRIQLFAGLEKNTGKTAKQFVYNFVESKKASVKVISSCQPSEQGLFTRICLETEEGPYRIMYSLFWGTSGMDLAVVSIAGTKTGLWSKYQQIFDTMGSFELIDMSRFPDKK